MDAGSYPSPIPFAAARAYAAATNPARVQNAFSARSQASTPAGRVASGIVDQVELSARPAAASASSNKVASLVAARVTVKPDFAPDAPAKGDALPMYRHPADKNAAAIGVQLGSRLDLNA